MLSFQIEKLPDEVILLVLSFLSIKDLIKCSQLSRRFRTITFDKSLWQKSNLYQKIVPAKYVEMVINKGCLYIFGGTDMDNKRLGDLWMYDLIALKWTQIIGKSLFEVSARSGHTASVFKGHMIIFGGMLSVTKEVDDTLAFNFETKEWL